MNYNGNFLHRVDPELLGSLREAGLQTALADLRSFRVKSYWKQPQLLLRDGWRLASDETVVEGRKPRCYVLGDARKVGQRLIFDRDLCRVRLVTFNREQAQEIQYDMERGEVLCNRMCR
ncbi:MAG: hypothetical protein AB1758_04445 [Candidatus Eremiobacterota bacterium]